MALSAVGGAILAYLAVLKLFGESVGTRPLLMVGFISLVVGMQFILTGVLAETLSRIYFESGAGHAYVRRSDAQPADSEAWHTSAPPPAR
jgi:hypothetical protein